MRYLNLFRRTALYCLLAVGLVHTATAQSKQVEIKTNMGSFTVMLYDDTPIHRDNFLKLVQEGAYNNIIFHRVIRNFMVQAGGNIYKGNADTKQALSEKYSHTLPAEIMYPTHFHKRGALAAARTANEVNPEKASSSFQFYVVVGQFYLPTELDDLSMEREMTMSDAIRKAYMTEGGTPHLDMEYTVFGEVVKGYKTIDKIQSTETDADDSPLKEIYIKSTRIVSK